MSNIYYASKGWTQKDKNPFTTDGLYGSDWSAFIYDESLLNISGYTNIYPDAKVYSLTVNPDIDESFQRLKDFISYESQYNRNIIVRNGKIPRDEIVEQINKNEDKRDIRLTDPKWLVHSTTFVAWKEIKKNGALLSPYQLKNLGKEIVEIGLKVLLEPLDYSEYIMLDVLNGCGELVVNSRNLGYVCVDPNMRYLPGVRLYFDAHKIIEDGLGIRDGLHVLKVHNRLSLGKYMVMCVDSNTLISNYWTPSTFTEAANNFFLKNII